MSQHPHEEIELRLSMATPAPWRTDRDEYPNSVVSEHANICSLNDGGQTRDRIDANARFIAHAPEDIRWLLDEVVKWEGRAADAALVVAKADAMADELLKQFAHHTLAGPTMQAIMQFQDARASGESRTGTAK